MEKYICKKKLPLPFYDEGGRLMEEHRGIFSYPGEIFERDVKAEHLLIACPPAVRLQNEKSWIEIMPETLEAHFVKISDNELVTVPVDDSYNSDKFTNELTRLLDSYTDKKISYSGGMCNYIMEFSKTKDSIVYSIRYPGATRGHIETDKDGMIKEIKLYHDIPSIYNEGAEEELQKFVGYYLILMED